MNIEDFVFVPKKEKKEKTCGKKMKQFWFLLTTMTVTKKERKKERKKEKKKKRKKALSANSPLDSCLQTFI